MAFWSKIGLRGKSVFVIVAIYLFVACVGAVVVYKAADAILDYFCSNYAKKSALLHKERILLPILRELTLSKKLADSAVIREWMARENDPELRRLALAELRSYRNFFQEHTYFVALAASHNFYFDDADSNYSGREVRQVLDPGDPDDSWFFSTMSSPAPFNLNIDSNKALGVTKLWINVPVDVNGQRLGIVGTGMDLSGFIHEFIASSEPGVSAMLFDTSGAIQAHQNIQLIDQNTLSKKDGDALSLVYSHINDFSDIERMRVSAALLKEGRSEVETLNVFFEGRQQLAALAFMPEIGLYVMILVDSGKAFDLSQFTPVLGLLGVLLVFVVALIILLLNRIVLEPLIRLTRQANAIAKGDYDIPLAVDRGDEIGQLGRAFTDMATKVRENTANLERRVQERTEELAAANMELQVMASTDALTGLYNRRAFMDLGENELKRAARKSVWPSILILDLDHFKRINDSWGHAAGDEVLRVMSVVLKQELREIDVFGRLGGEEFIALLPETALENAFNVAERVRSAIETTPINVEGRAIFVSASIGVACGEAGCSLDEIIAKADSALYRAKSEGRNRVCVSRP